VLLSCRFPRFPLPASGNGFICFIVRTLKSISDVLPSLRGKVRFPREHERNSFRASAIAISRSRARACAIRYERVEVANDSSDKLFFDGIDVSPCITLTCAFDLLIALCSQTFAKRCLSSSSFSSFSSYPVFHPACLFCCQCRCPTFAPNSILQSVASDAP